MLVVVPSPSPPPQPPRTGRWPSPGGRADPAFRTGASSGLRLKHGALVLKDAPKQRAYHGKSYDVGSWTSPAVTPGFGLTQLVASWSAVTPKNSWVEIRVRVFAGSAKSRWLVLGRWASSRQARAPYVGARPVGRPRPRRRRHLEGGRRPADVLPAAGAADAARRRVVAVPVGVVPGRGRLAAPVVGPRRLRSRGRGAASCSTSRATRRWCTAGEFSQYGGGGEAWCSPTSTAMVLGYYGRLPAASSYAWVGPRADPWVDEVARRTYDVAYEGTGNWPFNTAYAASRGPRRLRDPAPLAVGGRAAGRRRHPGDRLGVVLRPAPSTARRSRPPPATCW